MKIYGFLNSGGRAFAHLFLFFGAYARVSCKRQGLGSSLSLVNSDCTSNALLIAVCRRRIVAKSVDSMYCLVTIKLTKIHILHTDPDKTAFRLKDATILSKVGHIVVSFCFP